MCLPMWAHWCHLANTIELVLPSAHPSPQSKWQIDQFSRSCTAHGRKSLYLQWALLSPKIAPCDGGVCTPSNTWFPRVLDTPYRRNIHPPTILIIIHHPIFISFFHLLRSIASSPCSNYVIIIAPSKTKKYKYFSFQ